MHYLPKAVSVLMAVFWFSTAQSADHLTPAQAATVDAVLQRTEAYLKAGEIEQARNLLDQTAGTLHSDAIEIAQVLTLMQGGEYTHALSAAAHTYAEHAEEADTALLYAWLLSIGGQVRVAHEVLQTNLERFPEHQSLRTMQSVLQSAQWDVSQLDVTGYLRLRPVLVESASKSEHVLLLNGATLLDELHAVTPFTPSLATKKLWLRNGLGITVGAKLVKVLPEHHVAILQLEKPMPIAHRMVVANKPTSLGNLAYVIGYFTATKSDMAQWPILRADFTGMPAVSDDAGKWLLHIHSVMAGAPVFNPSGELMGISLNTDNSSQLLPINEVVKLISQGQEETAQPTKANPSMSELYEFALTTSLQLLAE